MRRISGLFDLIHDWDNLLAAVHQAAKGKRHRPDTQEFLARLGPNLESLARGIRDGTTSIGQFRQFLIHDPKERVITAPVFQERVLHHAIMNICEPYFDRWLIDDSFACRRGKGRVAALSRARYFQAKFAWCLHLDIRKYFDSIDQHRLLRLLERRFKNRNLLSLWRRIVSAYRGDSGRGLPIGALTSQHFANFYLGWFDRYVKETLRLGGYVRYMDDMLLWASSRDELCRALATSRHFLRDELGLELKQDCRVVASVRGVDFLGCRIFARCMILNRRSRRRFVRKLTELETLYEAGLVDDYELQARATALVAFTQTDGLASWRFRSSVLQTPSVDGR